MSFLHGLLRPSRSNSSSQVPHLDTASSHDSESSEGASISVALESGPLIMYGPPAESSGSVISGVLDLIIEAESRVFESAKLSIVQIFHLHDKNESVARDVLAQWNILEHPQRFSVGCHSYPFSHLLPGGLPPTVTTPLFTIKYSLEAYAQPAGGEEPLRLQREIQILRSVTSINDKLSVRVFPPTELNVKAQIPTALFPEGSLPLELCCTGLLASENEVDTHRWQPRRILWRLEEIVRYDGPRDSSQDPVIQKKVVAQGNIRNKFKVDYSGKGVCQYSTPDLSQDALSHVSVDVNDPELGLRVEHLLVIEITTGEEIICKGSKFPVLSGRARILRMQFRLHVCHRPGLGISWDDEVPPVYADVPLSPPNYEIVSSQPAMEEIPCMTTIIQPSPTLRHVDPTLLGPESSARNSLLDRFRLRQGLRTLSPAARLRKTVNQDQEKTNLRPARSLPVPGFTISRGSL